MPQATPISKIQLIDGTVVNLANIAMIQLPANSEFDVTWNISNFTGTTSLISGTSSDYLFSVNESSKDFYDIFDDLDKSTQTKNGCKMTYNASDGSYTFNQQPSANSYFYIYTNTSGFPAGMSAGDYVIFGARSGTSTIKLYMGYTTDGSTWTSLGSAYTSNAAAVYQIPSTAVGVRIYFYVTTTAFTNVVTHPIVLTQNY